MTLMRLIDAQTDRAWRKVAPAKIKREMVGADMPANAWRDVHLVGLPVADTVHAHPGDRLVIDVVENASTGYQWTVHLGDGGLAVAADRDLAVDLDGPPGSGSVRRFVIEVGNEPGSLELTLARPWESDIAAVRHETVDVAIDRTRRGIPERWFELA
jgi:predicted secreted protein